MKTKPILGVLIVGCLAMLCMLNPARAVANESLSREYMELLNAYRSSGDPDCGGGMPPVAALSVNEKIIEAAKLQAQGDNQALVKVGLGGMNSLFLKFPGGLKPITMVSMVKGHICSSLLDAGLMYIGAVESNDHVWIVLAGKFALGGAGSLLSGSLATAPVAPKKEVETEIDPTLPVLQLKSEPVSDTPWGRHFRISVAAGGAPFGSMQDFTAGPADFRNVYGSQRHFFFLPFPNAEAAVLWQDRSNGSIRLTMLDGELQLKGQNYRGQHRIGF